MPENSNGEVTEKLVVKLLEKLKRKSEITGYCDKELMSLKKNLGKRGNYTGHWRKEFRLGIKIRKKERIRQSVLKTQGKESCELSEKLWEASSEKLPLRGKNNSLPATLDSK